jgi:serine/threonine protein kinase
MSLKVGQKRFELKEQLGAGAFGEIYGGVDLRTGAKVAIKLEPANAEHPQLAYEARVYQHMDGKRGIPKMLYVGREGNYNVLVLERQGPNLEHCFNQCGRRFTLGTVLTLADKLLSLVQKVHDEGFVHRDIKPDNFVTGLEGGGDDVYIIDFGLSKCFWNPTTDSHIPFRSDKHLTGTARYASIGNHRGQEQSRRDDLESLGYVLVYFLNGSLPWQNQKGKSRRAKYTKMMEAKVAALEDGSLCSGLPEQFATYFRYVRQLKFEERPDYVYLRDLFKRLYKKCGFDEKTTAYDWQRLTSTTQSTHASSSVEQEKET